MVKKVLAVVVLGAAVLGPTAPAAMAGGDDICQVKPQLKQCQPGDPGKHK